MTRGLADIWSANTDMAKTDIERTMDILRLHLPCSVQAIERLDSP
jgi:hypothetical protein